MPAQSFLAANHSALVHIGHVSVPSRDPAQARQRDRRDRRTGGHNDQNRHNCGERRPAPAPTPEFLPRGNDLRSDRLAAKETTELVRQFLRRRIAALGTFSQTFEADGFQIAGCGGIQQAGANRLDLEDLSKRVRERFSTNGGRAVSSDRGWRRGIDIALRADSTPLSIACSGGK